MCSLRLWLIFVGVSLFTIRPGMASGLKEDGAELPGPAPRGAAGPLRSGWAVPRGPRL